MKRFILYVIFCFLILSVSCAYATTIVYTVPCALMRVWEDWDEQKQDSTINMDCSPGNSAREEITISLWWRPISPGATFQTIAQHTLSPCVEDSFPNQGPGHYYLTSRNSAGASCATSQLTILPGIMTNVELESPPKFDIIWFDIHGRLVTKRGIGVVTYKKKVETK